MTIKMRLALIRRRYGLSETHARLVDTLAYGGRSDD